MIGLILGLLALPFDRLALLRTEGMDIKPWDAQAPDGSGRVLASSCFCTAFLKIAFMGLT
jgi:hypothetical protein